MSPDDPLLTIPQAELARVLEEVGGMGGSLRFQAHGRSMWPFVRSGDTLVVQPLGARSVAMGDILLYRTPAGGVAAHRVTGFQVGALRIRGDRLSAPLELVAPDDVLGRVAAIERRGRRRLLTCLRAVAVSWIVVRPGLRACRNLVVGALGAVSSRGHAG